MFRLMSSSIVTFAEPCREDEVRDLIPSTCMTASSSGSTTSCSMTSGAAPSHVTETEIVGESTSGNWLMPMRERATPPKTIVAAISIQARTGLRMQTSVMFIRGPPAGTGRSAPRRARSP